MGKRKEEGGRNKGTKEQRNKGTKEQLQTVCSVHHLRYGKRKEEGRNKGTNASSDFKQCAPFIIFVRSSTSVRDY